MKYLILISAVFASTAAHCGDIENITCVLNSHRYGDMPMRQEITQPDATHPGGDKTLVAQEKIYYHVKAIVREGKREGRLYATFVVDKALSVSGSIFAPLAGERTELTDYKVGYSIICTAKKENYL